MTTGMSGRRGPMALALLCALLLHPRIDGTAQSPRSADRARLDLAGLERLVDSVVAGSMSRERAPGVAVTVVTADRVLLSKGYGVADIARSTAVKPDSTIFRIASISKLFTVTAVMQLAERGLLALDRDVNGYLRRLQVPAGFGSPLTATHLISHTSGLDELRPGTQASSEAGLIPLDRFLASRLVRIRPAGELPAYSTYGITLAGLLVEDVSGLQFEQYLRERIWAPLGMRETAITLTPAQRERLSGAYLLSGDSLLPQAYEWYHTTPASSVNATAEDMARFVRAQLGGRAADGSMLLGPATRREMQRPQARGHPDVPGFTFGFFEADYRGERILEHGGRNAGVTAGLVLFPGHDVGFFVASNIEGSSLGDELKRALVDRFLASGAAQQTPTPAPMDLARFAGRYRWDVYCRTCGRAAPTQGPVVAVDGDAITFAGRRWLPVGPLLFRRSDGAESLGFREDAAGRITHLFIAGPVTFERIPGG